MDILIWINEFYRQSELNNNYQPGVEVLMSKNIPEAEANYIAEALILLEKYGKK